MRAERLNKEKSEHVRIRKENEKKRLLEAQREATLGKIQKVKEELFASTKTDTRTNPEAGGGFTAFAVVPKKETTSETRVSPRKKKREEEVEEERGGRVGERKSVRERERQRRYFKESEERRREEREEVESCGLTVGEHDDASREERIEDISNAFRERCEGSRGKEMRRFVDTSGEATMGTRKARFWRFEISGRWRTNNEKRRRKRTTKKSTKDILKKMSSLLFATVRMT